MEEVSSEKIGTLRDIILNSADVEKESLAAVAHREADDWLTKETEKLTRETNLILQDARKRAEDIRRRQLLSAEREKSTETLRLQNRIISEALGRLQDKLVRLRDRDNYADILTGMCLEAVTSMKGADSLNLRLSAIDLNLADKIIANIHEIAPGVELTLDTEPAPILGGCWVTTKDNRRQVCSDWQSLTQEMADTLAEKLLPLL